MDANVLLIFTTAKYFHKKHLVVSGECLNFAPIMKTTAENGNYTSDILYHAVFAIWYAISLLPLCILYLLSDGLYFMVYYIARYRRHLVRKNLCSSFPNKSEKDIIKIEKEFYAWFCDYVVESVKLLSISRRQMERRMVFKGVERVKRSIRDGKSCAVYLGHYCNWEWVTSLPLAMDDEALCGQIYHKLENNVFDRIFLKLRGRLGATSISMEETLRRILEYRDEGKRMVIGFIADQVPTWNSIHLWTDFLHHDTPVFTGTERIARKCGFDVYYLKLQRKRRGYYEAEFLLITDDIDKCPTNSVTEEYFKMLEDTITAAPAFWLWSHNRWKRTRDKWKEQTSKK